MATIAKMEITRVGRNAGSVGACALLVGVQWGGRAENSMTSRKNEK